MARVAWNDAAFAALAKSAPVRAAVASRTQAICAAANARAEGHLGALRMPVAHGGTAPVTSFARPPYRAKVKTLSNTAFGAVETATPAGAADQSQFRTLDGLSG